MVTARLLAHLAGSVRISDERTLVDGVEVHARRVEGPGGRPPVVLVHGFVVSSRYFVPLLREMSVVAPTWAPDLPGFGRSGPLPGRPSVPTLAGWLTRWIEARGLGPALLAANSFGCQIAVQAAVTRPDLVTGLVLNGPTIDPQARDLRRQTWRWLQTSRQESLLQAPVLVRDYVDFGLLRARTMMREVIDDRIEDKLPEVRQPTVVLRGEVDRIVPRPWAEEVVRLLPQGRLTTVPGGAHTVNFTHPTEMAAVVRELLDQLEA